jgi:hypothetical protein
LKTLSNKTRLCGLGGTALFSALVFSGAMYLCLPTVKLGNLPKPNTLYQMHQEVLEPTTSPFGNSLRAGSMGQVPNMNGSTQTPPTAPSIPSLPVQPGMLPGTDRQGMNSSGLTVLGVLPPTVAILRDGGKTITVRVGDETSQGTVDSVTDEGVVVGEQFYGLKSGGK